MKMKFMQAFVLALSLFTAQSQALAQDNIISGIRNVRYLMVNGRPVVRFDIGIKRTVSHSFKLGNTSFFMKFTPGKLKNLTLLNVNPKYTLGDPNGAYNPIGTLIRQNIGIAAIQIYCTRSPGDCADISNSVIEERVATLQMEIASPGSLFIKWDLLNSAVVNEAYATLDYIHREEIMTNHPEYRPGNQWYRFCSEHPQGEFCSLWQGNYQGSVPIWNAPPNPGGGVIGGEAIGPN